MNKHTRLLVSLLFAVIIILAVGITRFYIDVSKDTAISSKTAEIVRVLDSDTSGNRIFEDGNGLFGIVDKSNHVIVEPQWLSLSFTEGEKCIASKHIGGKVLTGCIDYEGNAVVPLIYKSMTAHSFDGFQFYAAETDADGSCIVYDADFNPCFMRSWDSCTINGDSLILESGDCSFTYKYGGSGFTCTYASINGQACGKEFNLNISSRILLSKLNSFMLEKIALGISGYLEFALSGDQSFLSGITEPKNYSSFTKLFPEDEKILSVSVNKIPNIYIYSEKPDSASRQNYSVSIITELLIKYTDESGNNESMTGSYRAVLKMTADSRITAQSGTFLLSQPTYPADEPENGNDGDGLNPDIPNSNDASGPVSDEQSQ